MQVAGDQPEEPLLENRVPQDIESAIFTPTGLWSGPYRQRIEEARAYVSVRIEPGIVGVVPG